MIHTVRTSAEFASALWNVKSGDTIRLAPGTYGGGTLLNKDFAQTVTITSLDPDQPAVLTGRLALTNVSNVLVENLHLKVTEANSPDANRMLRIDRSETVTIRDLHVEGRVVERGDPGSYDPATGPVTKTAQYNSPLVGYPTGVGIGISDSRRVTVERTEVENFTFGISMSDVVDTRIANNHVHDLRHDGIRFSDARNMLIENNLIEDINPFHNPGGPTKYKDHGDHIQFWATRADFGVIGLTIRGNTLLKGEDGGYTQGIFGSYSLISGDDSKKVTLEDIQVYDNIINTGHRHGIYISDAKNVSVHHNTLVPPPKADDLETSGGVPLIMITASGKKLANGSVDPKVGSMPQDVDVYANIVVRPDAEAADTYKISPSQYATLGIVIGTNSILSLDPDAPNYWGKVYPDLVNAGIDAISDLDIAPGATGLVRAGTGARTVPDWIVSYLGGQTGGGAGGGAGGGTGSGAGGGVGVPRGDDTGTPGAVDLTEVTSYSAAGQDRGTASSITTDSVTLGGNAWKQVLLDPFTVTADTVLEFSFSVLARGEVFGIGFGTGSAQLEPTYAFQLGGSDSWGLQAFRGPLTPPSGEQLYIIRVGDFFTGTFDRLVLIADDDAKGTARARFGDIAIRSLSDNDPSPAPTEPYVLTAFQSGEQDEGTATIMDEGDSIALSGNAWKHVEGDFTITRTTVLTLILDIAEEGEIHGIGFANDDTLPVATSFQLSGTQRWGIQTHNRYDERSGEVRVTIEVGKHFTGSFDQLVLIQDDDGHAGAESRMTAIEIAPSLAAEPVLSFVFDDPLAG